MVRVHDHLAISPDPAMKRVVRLVGWILLGIVIVVGGPCAWSAWRTDRAHDRLTRELSRVDFPPGYERVGTLRGGCISVPVPCSDDPSVGQALAVDDSAGLRAELVPRLVGFLERQGFRLTEPVTDHCFMVLERQGRELEVQYSRFGDWLHPDEPIRCPEQRWPHVFAKVLLRDS